MIKAIEKYSQLKADVEKAGINYNECPELSQYLHIAQAMAEEEKSWQRHKREMYSWLKNIENSIIRDIRSSMQN